MTAYTFNQASPLQPVPASDALKYPVAPGSWHIAPNPLPLSWTSALGPLGFNPVPGASAPPPPTPLVLEKYQIFPVGRPPGT